jgi:hypothetical protein
MFHFALAGNMLTAIGGVPDIAKPSFVPTYPTHVLPGGIEQVLPVDLLPLSTDQLKVFMQIEQPEFPPVALSLAKPPDSSMITNTIGAFYSAIADAFTAINPAIDLAAHSVVMGEAVQITSVADAQAAIARIKGEGEGTSGSPDQPPADGTLLAHYYIFKQVLVGRKLVQSGGQWAFTGDAISFPKVFQFSPSQTSPDPSIAFNQSLSRLLTGLQSCWVTGQRPNIGAMVQLETLGQALIQEGVRPEFLWGGN